MVIICSSKYSSEKEKKYAKYFNMFPYILADFQKYSIEAIINKSHVLICAPTGSGKTTPAEFAIEYFISCGKKVVYTTPIKALSNQKYYDFVQKYPHISIGLMTGDIKLNPTAQVIICTAEILLNFLYSHNINNINNINNSVEITSHQYQEPHMQIDIDNELAAVVMDEVHFINDENRGKTWENTILTLPKHVQLIMLSATIDSPDKFAKWCETVTEREVCLSILETRAVPLIHYTYLTTTESIYKKIKDKTTQNEIRGIMNKLHIIKNEKNTYAIETYNTISKGKLHLKNNQIYMKQTFVVNSLLHKLKEDDMFPAIIFVFSKKNVERIAKEITVNLLEDDSKIPYIIKHECDQIIRSKLSNYEEYFSLPEYCSLIALLEKGVGIHHASMLPVLREIVEIMILKKYIKVLISTETFFIGLNCPIRTAIFTSLSKFDGNTERFLYSSEYQQGSGRCGRKGIDIVGHVIHLTNLFELPSTTEYKNILCGPPQKLVSKFRISYQLILRNLNLKIGTDEDIPKKTSQNNIVDYVKKSMMCIDIIKEKDDTIQELLLLENELINKYKVISVIKTPRDICSEYIDLSSQLKTAINKKQKEIEKSIKRLEDEYKFIRDDIIKYNSFCLFKTKIDDTRERITYLDTFIETQVQNVYNVLIQNNFIDDENYITQLGMIAVNISEIHCLVLSDILDSTEYFKTLDITYIIGYLSCFCGIRVHIIDGIEINSSVKLLEIIKTTQERLNYYQDYELRLGIYSGEIYEDVINTSLIDAFVLWCECKDEISCKYFIYSILEERGVPIGDFTKAILKISAICKELSTLNNNNIPVEFLHKLSLVDDKILKYIATSQSLYL